MKKQLRVGFDLDGVLLYNPLRITRPLVSIAKNLFFKKQPLHFYTPQKNWEKQIWKFFHKSSIFIAPGLDDVKKLIKNKKIKAYIVTARYSYLKNDLEKWLKKMKVDRHFSGIYYNRQDEQPHLYKERMIKKLGLDIFVEDNWDIADYLNPKTRTYWIYNIFDRNKKFINKFANLKSAVKKIKETIK